MKAEYRELFEYAAGFVTQADVYQYVPSDPSSPWYYRTFTEILATREVPDGPPAFEITETIALTTGSADRYPDPERYRWFRVFTRAVGLAVDDDDHLEGGRLAIVLLDDAHALGDRRLLELLVPAFAVHHYRLCGEESPEAPFLLLGLLLARAELGATSAEIGDWAERILAAEAEPSGRAFGDYLFGRAYYYDELRDHWRAAVRRALVPATPSAELLRKAVLAGPT